MEQEIEKRLITPGDRPTMIVFAGVKRVGQVIFAIQNQQNIRQMQRQYRHVRQPSQANTQELEL